MYNISRTRHNRGIDGQGKNEMILEGTAGNCSAVSTITFFEVMTGCFWKHRETFSHLDKTIRMLQISLHAFFWVKQSLLRSVQGRSANTKHISPPNGNYQDTSPGTPYSQSFPKLCRKCFTLTHFFPLLAALTTPCWILSLFCLNTTSDGGQMLFIMCNLMTSRFGSCWHFCSSITSHRLRQVQQNVTVSEDVIMAHSIWEDRRTQSHSSWERVMRSVV